MIILAAAIERSGPAAGMQMQTDLLSQAFEQARLGRLDEAEKLLEYVLAANAESAPANHLMGAIRLHQDRAEDALPFAKRAAASSAATAEMHCILGAVLYKLGNTNEAIDAYERSLAVKPGHRDALDALANIYRAEQKSMRAADSPRPASIKPELLRAMPDGKPGYRGVVPGWHFAMMDDKKRNEAYEAAIRRAVPGKRVLDIGTGAGLLALMAARAGAAKVTTCEAVAAIAERARQIIVANGMSDRITVVPMKSTALSVPGVLSERAEVLVTETFASGLITEGVLPTVEHAHEYLLTENATVIPQAASVMGYLAGGPKLHGMLFVDRIAGFDLSAFNEFAPPMLDVALDNVQHRALSDDVELVRFDLRQKRFPAGGVRLVLTATRHGVCVGVAQWIRLELDAQTTYENRPTPQADYNGHWTHIVHRFPKPVTVAPGDVVPILFRHDRTQIGIDLLD
jgi:type II protein arginine methyltransferase